MLIMNKEIINTPNAPSPIGPYSQAVRTGNLLFISGQIPLDPATGNLIEGSAAEETQQIMKNLKAVLTAAGCDFSNVIKTNIFLSDMSLFASVNEVYTTYFSGEFPARDTIAVK